MRVSLGSLAIPTLISFVAGVFCGQASSWGLVFWVTACVAQLYVLDRRDPRGIYAMIADQHANQGEKP
jgi:hypothetical protein